MSIENLYPSVKPSLDLNFAAGNFDPRITFSRASGGTVYDGRSVVKAEENLLKYSQDLTNSSWVKNSTTVATSGLAPDGSNSANLVAATAVNAFHAVVVAASAVSAGAVYQISVYAKAGTAGILQIFSNNAFNSTDRANFDLTAGAVTAASGSYSGASISPVGSGWYRCIVPITAISSIDPGVYFAITDSSVASRANTWLAAGTENLLLWGAQLEQRSQVTAYTPTTSQPVTNYVPVLQTAPANVPRIDYDPITGECKGLLIEEQRTNLLTYSEQFDNAAWIKSSCTVTANTVTAPDGTLTADKLSEDTTNSTHQLSQNSSFVSGTSYTFSFFAKRAERSAITMYENILQGTEYAKFNLDTGVVTPIGSTTGWTRNAISMNPVGNGWYRCVVTATPGANVTNNAFITRMRIDNGTTTTYTGDGYSGVYIWGAQLESGSFPTSYIKTEASQVTRAADAASMIGTNFSSWYRQDEGTLFSLVISPGWGAGVLSSAASSVSLTDGTQNNSIYFGRSAASSRPFWNSSAAGISQADITTSTATWPAGTAMKLAGVYKFNDYAASTDASPAAVDTSAAVPAVSQLQLGVLSNVRYWNGHIKRITYYPKRLSNTELQALTT